MRKRNSTGKFGLVAWVCHGCQIEPRIARWQAAERLVQVTSTRSVLAQYSQRSAAAVLGGMENFKANFDCKSSCHWETHMAETNTSSFITVESEEAAIDRSYVGSAAMVHGLRIPSIERSVATEWKADHRRRRILRAMQNASLTAPVCPGLPGDRIARY